MSSDPACLAASGVHPVFLRVAQAPSIVSSAPGRALPRQSAQPVHRFALLHLWRQPLRSAPALPSRLADQVAGWRLPSSLAVRRNYPFAWFLPSPRMRPRLRCPTPWRLRSWAPCLDSAPAMRPLGPGIDMASESSTADFAPRTAGYHIEHAGSSLLSESTFPTPLFC